MFEKKIIFRFLSSFLSVSLFDFDVKFKTFCFVCFGFNLNSVCIVNNLLVLVQSRIVKKENRIWIKKAVALYITSIKTVLERLKTLCLCHFTNIINSFSHKYLCTRKYCKTIVFNKFAKLGVSDEDIIVFDKSAKLEMGDKRLNSK